jgi:histidyl-tRNA synthetase
MNISIPPGVFDILPSDPKEAWRSSYLWQYVESTAREMARCYGFREIRTPIFERTELFQRSVGETTDIVTKEMYTFTDKGNRSMTLRPEGTASAMRALIESQVCNHIPQQKLFYIGPMFRYERAQAGRYRQHHQFGVEAIGTGAPEQDAEVIDLLYSFYAKLGLKNLTVNLNSIGDNQSRASFRESLLAYYQEHFEKLSTDSKTRFSTNPLRILDSKDPTDCEINKGAPSIQNFLSEEDREHFAQVRKLLDGLRIPYTVNHLLVRGLDYYNKTVFEIVAGELGAQNSVGGGGRYDGLIHQLGGPDLPAMGFGTGIERVLQTMLKQQVWLPEANVPAVFFIALGDEAKRVCFGMLHTLRENGISAEMDYSTRKLNKIMHYANEIGARYVAVVGDNELETGKVELKDMKEGTKRSIHFTEIQDVILI